MHNKEGSKGLVPYNEECFRGFSSLNQKKQETLYVKMDIMNEARFFILIHCYHLGAFNHFIFIRSFSHIPRKHS